MKRRILSILLTCIMVIGMLPAAVFADETGNTGTSETPAYETPEGYIAVEIPVIKNVNSSGIKAEFLFNVVVSVKSESAKEISSVRVLDNEVIVGGGSNTYNDQIVIAVSQKDAEAFANGYTVTITEVDGKERGWIYSENVATVEFDYNDGVLAVDSISNDQYEFVEDIKTAIFDNYYDLFYEVNIPVEKIVEANDEGTVPAKDFEFEVYALTEIEADGDSKTTITGKPAAAVLASASVPTNGAGKYSGSIKLGVTRRELLAETIYVIVEKNDGAYRWDYSENAYAVKVTPFIIAAEDLETTEHTVAYYSGTVTESGVSVDMSKAIEKTAVTFTNTYTVPEEITVEIPFTKVVELGSNGVPGEETFQFEAIFPFMNTEGTSLEAPVVSVETDGAGEYEDTLVITVSEDDLGCLGEGFILREVQGTAAYWEYDETAWYIALNDLETAEELTFTYCKAVYEEAEDATVEGEWVLDVNNPEAEIVFTNTYTREVSRFGRDLRILLRSVFDVEASASEGGSISKPGISKVFFKHAIKYTITPAEGYEIEAVYVDGKNVGAVESYIFRDVTKDHTINAVFAAVEG